jgi:hypothetical protein
MPLKPTPQQIAQLCSAMEGVCKTYGYGRERPPSTRSGRTTSFMGTTTGSSTPLCNCWEAIFIAGRTAGLNYTQEDIVSAGRKTAKGDLVLAVYMFEHRRFLMFPEKARSDGAGIPSGLAQPGDLLMWGPGDHVAIASGGDKAYEFERTDHRKGERLINDIDQILHTLIVICAPLPEPGELKGYVNQQKTVDYSQFDEDARDTLALRFINPPLE